MYAFASLNKGEIVDIVPSWCIMVRKSLLKLARIEPNFIWCISEDIGSIIFGRYVSNWLKTTFLESWRQELSIGIYIYMGTTGEGGGPSGGFRILAGVFRFFLSIEF